DPLLRISTGSDSLAKQLGTDYLPILDSPSAEVRGPIVFVGYGIVDPTQGLDDYKGVDTTNAIVLFLRGKPTHYKGVVGHADKVRLARQKGRSEEHTSELQSRFDLVCRLLLEIK